MIKTTEEIVEKYYFNEDGKSFNLKKKWVDYDWLIKVGIDIECQANGSNNPEDLEGGIFIPYRLLKKGEE